jgi:tetratricopeptide (TPR) repeat protein
MREVALLSRKGAAGGSARGGTGKRTQRYWAFLSYSHKDSEIADWLHSALEKYRVPRTLVGRETSRGMIPAGFSPIFRDRHELAASGDLGHTIREALAESRCLIVLCSPEAARSRWTNEEIFAFRKAHPDFCVLAAIVEGEPFASEVKGHEAEECFPPALRQKFDSRGRPTGKRAEPIAADLRETGDGRQLGLLKIVAGMIGVGLDDLVQREQQRRHKKLTYIAAASLAGMVVTSGLSIYAFDKRDEARDQRREAEGLVGFMLGDLREKLEPIGQLDALDSVGVQALRYFEKQDLDDLSDAALAQRGRALTLMGEIAQTRGDVDGALVRFREAMASTGEMVRRSPDNAGLLFDHAQNVFYVGSIAMQRGDLPQAEAAMREYRNLAYRMAAIEPANPKYQLEIKYGDTNLGTVLFKQRRFGEAAKLYERTVIMAEKMWAAEPGNLDHPKSLSESLAWLADAQFNEGRLDEAIGTRERQVALIERLLRSHPNDVTIRQKEIPARRVLGRLLASQGSLKAGLNEIQAAVHTAEQLMPTEPGNMEWVEFAAGAQLDLAQLLLLAGRTEDAAVQVRAGCDLANRLAARKQDVAQWRKLEFDCLSRRANVALKQNAEGEALALASRALAAARRLDSGNNIEDWTWVARALHQVAEAKEKIGDRAGAQRALQAAIAAWPRGVTESPRQMGYRAEILAGLGRQPEARELTSRLEEIGYRVTI